MNRVDALRRLHGLGHAPEFRHVDSKFLEWCVLDLAQELISRYQAHHNLAVTGKMTPQTQQHLDAPRCGHPDRLAVTSESCWSLRSLNYYQQISYPGSDPGQVAADYAEAIRRMTMVCGMQISPTAIEGNAQIVAKSGRIDGAWNVLALTELPPPSAGRGCVLNQTFDIAEIGISREQRIAMMAHEAGHFLGLGHAPPGSGALMEPVLSTISSPQAWDIAQLQERYGPPGAQVPTPTPTPTPTPPVPPPSIPPSREVSKIVLSIPAPGSYQYQFHFDDAGTYLLLIVPVKQA